MLKPAQSPAIVVTQTDQLQDIVENAVLKALATHDGRPALLTRDGLARALCCSAGQVDALRKRGLPTLWLGDAPRFDLAAVLAWLHSENDNGSTQNG